MATIPLIRMIRVTPAKSKSLNNPAGECVLPGTFSPTTKEADLYGATATSSPEETLQNFK